MFDEEARSRLQDKLDYERWALDELENEYRVFPDELGGASIEDGRVTVIAKAGPAKISQGRVENVIQRLYPLIFAASYKSLDMIVEWILEETTEGFERYWGYEQKASRVNNRFDNGDLPLPEPLEQDLEIPHLLFILYSHLRDHRNAVVHRQEFKIDDDVFSVTDGEGVTFEFDSTELFSLAKVGTVSADILLDDRLTDEQERGLKRYLDNLAFVHAEVRFDIAPPWAGRIEYHVEAVDSNPYTWSVEMDLVRRADSSSPETKGYFLLVLGKVGEDVRCVWEIPSDDVPDVDTLVLTEDGSEFREFRTE